MAQESWKMDQDETECQRPELSVPCLNNCGFLGTPATMNLCYKCYRDVLHKKAIAFPSTVMPPTTIGEASSTLAPSENNLGPVEKVKEKEKETINTSSATATIADRAKEVVPPRASVSLNRCFCCRRRVGLSGFRCRCGDIFCSSHRYSDTHECSYDYKRAGREAIAKANPVVKAEKIRKI